MALQLETNITADEGALLRDRLNEHNIPFVGPRNATEFGFAVRNDQGEVTAGLTASCVWEWLCIDILWVSDTLRGQGVGSQLLLAAEQEGIKQHREMARLNTFSFQARPFYERHGYRVVSELADFPKGHSQFKMIKSLI